MRGWRSNKKWIRGFTLIELVVVAAIVSAIPGGSYAKAKQKAEQTVAINNLQQIGLLIQGYVDDNGGFPKASFYPKDPLQGEDSIRKILGSDGRLYVSSAMPPELLAKGLTYVYNDELAGKQHVANAENTWVLIDFTCVSTMAPYPWPNGYNILYADGHVATTKELPQQILALRQQNEGRAAPKAPAGGAKAGGGEKPTAPGKRLTPGGLKLPTPGGNAGGDE